MTMKPHPALRVVEPLSTAGYFLIIGGVIYFIIGAIVNLVHGNMLSWTFCGSVHHLFGLEWCGYEPHTGWGWGDSFAHHLLNAALPWVMLVMGFFLLAICLPLMKFLGYEYSKHTNRDN